LLKKEAITIPIITDRTPVKTNQHGAKASKGAAPNIKSK
jgi:hypothetical protein